MKRLIGRPRELTDNVTPSGTSLAVEALLRLAALTGEEHYRDYAARVVLALAGRDDGAATAGLRAPARRALYDFIGPLYEIAIVGAAGDPATIALRQAIVQPLPTANSTRAGGARRCPRRLRQWHCWRTVDWWQWAARRIRLPGVCLPAASNLARPTAGAAEHLTFSAARLLRHHGESGLGKHGLKITIRGPPG